MSTSKIEWTDKVRFFFAWYDGWVGYYWDQRKRRLYICPLPWCVFEFQFKRNRGLIDTRNIWRCPDEHHQYEAYAGEKEDGSRPCPVCGAPCIKVGSSTPCWTVKEEGDGGA